MCHDNTVLSTDFVALPSLAHALQVAAAPSGWDCHLLEQSLTLRLAFQLALL